MKLFAVFWQKLGAYLKNLLIAIDQFAGALILGNHADITISAQAWLWHLQGKRDWPYLLIDTLFWFDDNHCQESFENECKGSQLPEECRPKPEEQKNKPP